MQPLPEHGGDLTDARAELAAAASRLRRLKRLVSRPSAAPARADAWRGLLAALQTLADSLSACPASGDAPPDPAAAAKREELSRARQRLELELERIDREQAALDERRGLTLAQLDAAARGWSLLAHDAGRVAAGGAKRDLLSALGQLQRCVVACERAAEEERTSSRLAAEARRAWSWVTEVSFPSFEKRLAGADGLLLLPTLRRLLEAIDGRLRARAAEPAPAAPDRADRAPAGAPAALPAADVERLTAVWAGQVEALDAALEKALAEKAKLAGRLSDEKAKTTGLTLRLRFVLRQVAKLRRRLSGRTGPGGSTPPPLESGA